MYSVTGDSLNSFYSGVVVDNQDPKGLGRLQIRIPAIAEPSTGWALPFGMPGGGDTQSGTFDIPKAGAEVVVLFVNGDPDHPRWTYGNWGAPKGESDIPEPAKSIIAQEGPAAAGLIKASENDKFQMFTDMREGKARLVIRSKKADPEDLSGAALMIELDDANGTIAISAPAGVSIKSLGSIEIDALNVTINGRPVIARPGAI